MASNARPVTVNSYGQKFVEKVTSELLKKKSPRYHKRNWRYRRVKFAKDSELCLDQSFEKNICPEYMLVETFLPQIMMHYGIGQC